MKSSFMFTVIGRHPMPISRGRRAHRGGLGTRMFHSTSGKRGFKVRKVVIISQMNYIDQLNRCKLLAPSFRREGVKMGIIAGLSTLEILQSIKMKIRNRRYPGPPSISIYSAENTKKHR